MISIKRFWFLIPAALLVLTAAMIGCNGGNDDTDSVALIAGGAKLATVEPLTPSPPEIALIMKTLTNPFFIEMERGARQAEKELNIRLRVQTAAQETSIKQQIEIVEQNIHAGIDAIVIAPGDSLELIPVLKKAQDADIPVINIDNRLNPIFCERFGLKDVPFISVDNEQAAYLSARRIGDQISAPTEAIILEGIRGAANAEARKNGAIRAFRENPHITVVATETAHWKIDEGYQVTKALFTRHPSIGAIFSANDMMALGALNYLREAGRLDVLIASFDALAEAKQAIRAGRLAVTIDQQAAQQGYLGVQYAVRALAGEQLPTETLIAASVVDATTLQ